MQRRERNLKPKCPKCNARMINWDSVRVCVNCFRISLASIATPRSACNGAELHIDAVDPGQRKALGIRKSRESEFTADDTRIHAIRCLAAIAGMT